MTMTRKSLALSALLVVAIVVIGGWLVLRPQGATDFAPGARVDLADYRDANPTGVPSALAGANLVTRGEYLARAGDCIACHTAPGKAAFAGGLPFKLPFGTLYSPNITPDKATGIGNWSDEDFLNAMHNGVNRDGQHLYPAFPYASYALLTRDDVLAIKAYLFSLKPVANTPPAMDLVFPFNQRYLMWFWNVLFKPGHRYEPNTAQTPQWNRGAYLAEALAHCGDCHTPRNLAQGLDNGRKFAGAMIEGWKAYNITQDPKWGVGAWSEAQLSDYLSSGHAQGRSSAAGPMAEAVDHSLRFLTREDIQAMVTYLKTVPAIGDGGEAAVPTPAERTPVRTAAGGNEDLGARVFAGACASCHNADGSGAIVAQAALSGNRTLNDRTAVNATQAVLQGAKLRSVHGEVFMPAFANGYSDAELAAVLNYITGRFGSAASALTPAEIAKRRAEAP
jgi:mono/diheme cytochrome c family protein